MSHKLRTGGQVPVGIPHADVAEVSRKYGEQLLDGHAGSIPVHERLHGKTMSKVVNAWAAVSGAGSQADLPGEPHEHSPNILVQKPPATLGDEIVLRTWVGKATGLTFERFTEIRRKSDHQLFSQARTLWCPVNTQTGRPMRVSGEVRAQFSV